LWRETSESGKRLSPRFANDLHSPTFDARTLSAAPYIDPFCHRIPLQSPLRIATRWIWSRRETNDLDIVESSPIGLVGRIWSDSSQRLEIAKDIRANIAFTQAVTKRAGRKKDASSARPADAGRGRGGKGGIKRAVFETSKKKEVGVSDLTLISKISNEAINDNLKKRFENGEIYVRVKPPLFWRRFRLLTESRPTLATCWCP